MRKLKKHCFLMYYEFQSIQLNALENIYSNYWLTYSTRISYQTRKHCYLLFAKILYLLWNVCGDNET